METGSGVMWWLPSAKTESRRMPAVVSFASPKGGVGKTSSALVLATELAQQGAAVTIIDADPNRHLVAWRAGPSRSPVRVVADTGRLVSLIDAERAAADLVVVDLEGSASRAVGHAIARSDLVIIPAGASAMDVGQAGRAIELVREEGEVLGREIAARLLFTRTSPQIPTKAEKAIVEELRAAGVPMLRERLHQRQAFGAMFSYRLSIEELDPREVNGLEAARANALALTSEITAVLNDIHDARQAA
jgi:chromosome partitioning protein